MSYFLAYMERNPEFALRLYDRPISFQRLYVSITGKITAALMLSAAMQWAEDGDTDGDGWFSKTGEDWSRETGMSKDEQATAKARLLDLGIFEERRFRVDNGMRLVIQYRINFDVIDRLAIEDDMRHRALAAAH
ncbi:hypothetical protein JY96_21520 [Aquabacterium sp. NJ1]|uniref:hypothetical protein n=1 Tax=Aquabacterium sp. NJ1 TaxID=1538295 RepID=UPI00052E2858|nr:hypothetical protein [Aquabacterium sp. NJ1]KGM38745.1 hypothetical protein JY96_21520 [Aquabacterium sp. NJ1]